MARKTSEEARRAVQIAARDVLDERGVAGFSVDAVAEASGVAKTTIYRHWRSAHHLMLDTARQRLDIFATPNTGSARGDLIAFFTQVLSTIDQAGSRSLMLDVLAQSSRDPALDATKNEMLDGHLQPIRTILELAQLRGEISSDVDLDTAVSVVMGPLFHRRIVQGRSVDRDDLSRIVDMVLVGLARN